MNILCSICQPSCNTQTFSRIKKKKKDDGDTFPQYIVSKIGLILNTKQKHKHGNNFKGNI